MTQIVEFETLKPVTLTVLLGNREVFRAVPEGGKIGFCGKRLYCIGGRGTWFPTLTDIETLLVWMQAGYVKKLSPMPLQAIALIKKRMDRALQMEAERAAEAAEHEAEAAKRDLPFPT